jgi:hypothetical protein
MATTTGTVQPGQCGFCGGIAVARSGLMTPRVTGPVNGRDHPTVCRKPPVRCLDGVCR